MTEFCKDRYLEIWGNLGEFNDKQIRACLCGILLRMEDEGANLENLYNKIRGQ